LNASVTGSSTDVINGDTVTFANTSATFDTKNVGTGKTVTVAGLSISGTDAGNYNLTNTSTTATADISKKDLAITATAANKVYDTTTAATATLASNKLGGDTLTLATTGATFSDKNVGTGKTVTVAGLSISGTDAGNYNLTNSSTSATAAISQAALTVIATQVTKIYDRGLSATGTGTVGTLAGVGDSVSNTGSQAFVNKNAGTGKTVTASGVTIKDAANADMTGNYNITYLDNATSTITPKTLTLAGTSVANKVYDGNTNATITAQGNLSGLVGSETLILNGLGGAFSSAAVGVHKAVALVATLQNGSNGGLDSNYTLAASTAYADITKADSTGTTVLPIIVPPAPVIPSENNTEGGGGSNGGSSSGNPYLLMPVTRPNDADRCTPNTLEDCLCETQEPLPIEGIAICYQPKKTASTKPAKGRRS
jgi:hypothetical protein